MTSTFRLTLDTHAPSVVWGGATGATAGELLRVPYVSDEPLHQATLVMNGGRRLALTVQPDHVEVLLPPDATDGPASIEVKDDVGNTRTYAAVFSLSGTTVVVPPYTPQPSTGFPGPPRRRRRTPAPEVETVVLTSESTISTTSTTHVAEEVVPVAAVSTSTAEVVTTRTRSRASEVATAVSIQVRAVVTSDSGRTLEREVVVRRRDDPETEALLLLL